MTTLSPYLNFRGDARSAMEFYRTVFGGDLTVTTFGEFDAGDGAAEKDLVMHAQLTANGMVLMGSDTPPRMEFTRGSDFSVSLSGEDSAELTGYWERLSEGGTVIEPLTKAPWGDSFGMCKDSFGVTWLVNIAGSAA